eukprot:TRINITY_DN9945_c0_g1_i1.p1 TRINITY_DN9945_c0_g1~~TRINITY_DN9945_c0_g1_i1.p1  ORF type:complete len:110 (+),score=42.78 TRINITY_DN9945_c0_g1_i1:167-496(+)
MCIRDRTEGDVAKAQAASVAAKQAETEAMLLESQHRAEENAAEAHRLEAQLEECRSEWAMQLAMVEQEGADAVAVLQESLCATQKALDKSHAELQSKIEHADTLQAHLK